MSKLLNKVALVTGASKGIGAGIATSLAAEGAAVAINYASSKEAADKIVDQITKRGGRAVAVQGDISKPGDIQRVFAEAHRLLGPLDILVRISSRKLRSVVAVNRTILALSLCSSPLTIPVG